MSRYIAKNVVAADLAERCEVNYHMVLVWQNQHLFIKSYGLKIDR